MEAGVEPFIQANPLLEGEELVCAVDALMLGDETQQVTRIVVTDRRLGCAHTDNLFFVPLQSLVSTWLDDTPALLVQFDNDVVLGFSVDEPEQLFGILLDVRAHVMRDEAAAEFCEGLECARRGQWERARRCLERAAQHEPINRLPELALHLVQRRLGLADEAATTLLQQLPSLVNIYPRLMELPLTCAFSGPQLHWLEQLCGDPESANTGVLLTLYAAMAAGRRGDFDRVEHLLEVAFALGEADPVVMVVAALLGKECAPVAIWPRLAEMHASAVEKAIEDGVEWPFLTEEANELIRRMADVLVDPLDAARADTQLEEYLGEASENGAPWRTLEDWDSVLEECKQRLSFPRAALLNLASNREGMEQVMDWLVAESEPAKDVEHLWATMRRGEAVATSKLQGKPVDWWQRIAEVHPLDSPLVWLAGLLGVELLLRRGEPIDARQLLRRALKRCATQVGSGQDIYSLHASSLYGLFMGLADQDASAVRLYERVLTHQPGFKWVPALADDLMPEGWREYGPERVDLEAFATWAHDVCSQLGLDQEPNFTRARSALDRARKAKLLRVVVGGETSSGKSSFINALLGEPVLFVTQEEATAVPTMVVRGSSWTARAIDNDGKVQDSLDVGGSPSGEQRRELEAFVKRYTALASEHAKGVGALRLTAPVPHLAKGVVLVDTPGLNAHAVRTRVAQSTIDNAHACIFVLDAASALKGGEVAKIQWASEAVGKTIFVINKMDRAVGDDELDVDDDAAGDLLARVTNDLCARLGSEDVNLFAVCSLDVARLKQVGAAPEALAYAEAIGAVRSRVTQMLQGSRQRLIEYSASKLALVVAEIALDNASRVLVEQERRMADLAYQMPSDPAAFQQGVFLLLEGIWANVGQTYITNIQVAIDQQRELVQKQIWQGMEGCEDNEQLGHWVKRAVRPIFNDYVARLDQARLAEWQKVGTVVVGEVHALFESLYEGASFKPNIDSNALVAKATPLPLARPSPELSDRLEELVGSQILGAGAGAAAGAAVGTLLFPVFGTILGGVLGGLAGGGMVGDPKEGLLEAVMEEFDTLEGEVVESANADISTPQNGGRAPILEGLSSGIEAERRHFVDTLRREIARLTVANAKSRLEADAIRRRAIEASDWCWRFQTRANADLGEP